MDYKKNFLTTIFTTLGILLIIMCVVIVLDPYFHYHKPIEGIPYTLEDELYIDAGVLENYDYDSVIIGSSLAQLLEPSVIDNYCGTKTVIATMSGMSTKNAIDLMNYAIKHNKNLKNIYYSLDYHAVTGDKDDLTRELPKYLYDDNPLTDTEYLLNKNTWIDGIGTLFDINRSTELITDFDNAYKFDLYVQFSKRSVVSNMSESFTGERIEYRFKEYDSKEEYIRDLEGISPEKNVADNITCNIIPMLENNSNINFYFYMAPIPLLNWYDNIMMRENEDLSPEKYINQVSANLTYIFKELSVYDNCHLYFFYDDPVTEDIYRYTDLVHWDRRVGRHILNTVISGSDEITRENADRRVFDFYKRVTGYEPNLWNGTIYSFQNTDGFDEYLEEISGDDFVKILLINADITKEQQSDLISNGYISGNYSPGKYYVSMVANGKIISEHTDSEPFEYDMEYDGKPIHIETAGFSKEASIMINDGEYCPEEENIDIVVYDKNKGMVVDSVGLCDENEGLIHY